MSHAQLKYLDKNYSPEQAEEIKKDLCISRFAAREAHYYWEDNVYLMSEYDPAYILSNDSDLVRNCV